MITDVWHEWIWFIGIVGLGIGAYYNPDNFVLNLMAFMDWAEKRSVK